MINLNQKILNLSLKYWLIVLVIVVLLFSYTCKENMTNTSSKPKLILYWANWCPHCETFLPKWNQFKNSINTDNLDIEDYDCAKTENENKCNVSDIPGFPTVIKQIGENRIEYQGPRTVKGLRDFINQ